MNNFAISSGGIGEALERSASSLMAANNTIDESIALITAANTVVQDPEQVGTAFKTISMRIRGAKTELAEAGLETDGMVESTAKLRSEILALTGVDIMDGANQFKSTYKIMDELAAKWEDLSDIQQATVTELIAGKRQGNIVSSLMTNFDTARDALETSLNSTGSAMQEHEKWQKSLEAQILKLKASWQGLSQAFLSSDFLHRTLEYVIKLVDGITQLIDTFGTLPTLLGTIAAGMSVFKNAGFISILNKNIAGTQKQLSLLGKSFNNISRDSKSGQGLFTSLFRNKITKSDIGYITDYFNQVKSGVPVGKAYANTLSHASVAGKQMAVNIRKGTASMSGLKTAATGGKAALFGLEVAATAANIALTMGLSLAIQGIVSLVSKWINADKELAESVEEVTSKFKEQSNELQKLKGDYDTSNESSMISKYAKLSKGVDTLGRNVSLTADEYSEYQGIVNQIANQIPSLVSGYDSQGNALLSVKGNVEELTAAYEKLIHAQNQEILTNTGNIEKDFSNTIDTADGQHWWSNGHGFWAGFLKYGFNPTWDSNAKWGLGSLLAQGIDYDLKNDTVQGLKGLLSTTINDKEKQQILEQLRKDAYSSDEIRDALEGAGIDVGTFEDPIKVLEQTLKTDPQKIKNIVDDYYTQFAEVVEEQKTIAQAKLSEAFDVSSAISGLDYGNITEELQTLAYQTVSNLDLDFFTELQEQGKTVEQWTTELLNQLNAIGKINGSDIEDAFELQTQFNGGDIDYGDYISKLKEVESVIDELDLKDEAKTQLKISLGLDENGVVDQYDALIKRLTTGTENSLGLNATAVQKFIDDLSVEEFSVLTKIVPNLEAGTTLDEIQSLIDDKLAEEFTFDITVQTEGIEALNTALAEARSAAGLTSESIAALEARYEDLDGFNAAALFEKTANGIRLNSDELSRLEEQYVSTNKLEIDKNLNTLIEKYQDVTKEIKNCTDAQKKEELQANADYYKDKIDELSTLASQYDGLTSAFTKWQSALDGAEEGDNYDSVFENLEAMKELDDKRLYGTDKYKTFAQLMSYEDLSSANIDEIGDAFDKGYKKAQRYFTESKRGSNNFLNDLNKINSEWAKKNKNGDWEVNINAEEAAKKLGISVEAVMLLLDKLKDYGVEVNVETTSVDSLKTDIQESEEKLQKLGRTPHKVNLDAADVQTVDNEIESLKTHINEVKNDSSISVEVRDAELADARLKLEALIKQRQELNQPSFMKLDTSQVQASMVEALTLVQNYQEALNEVNRLNELKKSGIPIDDTELKTAEQNVKNLASQIQGLPEEVLLSIGIKDTSQQGIQNAFENGEITIDANTDPALTKVEQLAENVEKIEDKDVTINVTVNGLDDVKELNKQIDLATDIKGDIDTLSEYVENAKALSELDDNIATFVTAEVRGNVTETKEKKLERLKTFAESAPQLTELKKVGSFTTDIDADVNAKVKGNVVKITEEAINNLSVFADEAKTLKDAELGSDVAVSVTAKVKGNVVKKKEEELNNLSFFADEASELKKAEIGTDVNVKVTANVKGNVVKKDEEELNNISFFANEAKTLQNALSDAGIDGAVEAKVTAKVAGNVIKTKEEALNNISVFADEATKLKDANIGTDTKAKIKAEVKGNVVEKKEKALDNLSMFADEAKALKKAEIGSDVKAEVKANVEGNVVDTKETSLDNIGVFIDQVDDLKDADIGTELKAEVKANVKGNVVKKDDISLSNLSEFATQAKNLEDADIGSDIKATVKANIKGNVVEQDENKLNNLSVFASEAQKLKDAEIGTDIKAKIKADVKGNVVKQNVDEIKNIGVFIDEAKALKDADIGTDLNAKVKANVKGNVIKQSQDALGNLSVFANEAKELEKANIEKLSSTVTAKIKGNVIDRKEIAIDNLSVFAKHAKKLKEAGIGKGNKAEIKANITGNVIDRKEIAIDNLSVFAEHAKALKNAGIGKGNKAEIKANITGNVIDRKEIAIDNLSVFAKHATALKDAKIGTKTKASVSANVYGNVVNKEESSLSKLSTFINEANKLNDVPDDISRIVSANAKGNVIEGENAKSNLTSLTEFNSIANSMTDQTVTVSVAANVDAENINQAITLLQGVANSGVFKDYKATVQVGATIATIDDTTVQNYKAPQKDGKVAYSVDSTAVDNWLAPTKDGIVNYSASVEALTDAQKHKTGTITYKAKISGFPIVNGTANANGSAFANGTSGKAFKQGDWGVKKTTTALTGELGQELVVYKNRWYTVGDNGAEFATIPKGAIVFNHKQTAELFKNGKVTSNGGRGKALANGTLPTSGTAFASGTDNESFDFLETLISRLEDAISDWEKSVDKSFVSWAKRFEDLEDGLKTGGELGELIGELTKAVDVTQDGSYANNAKNAENTLRGLFNEDEQGIVNNIITGIKTGLIDSNYVYGDGDPESKINEAIKEFQKWYDLQYNAEKKLAELRDESVEKQFEFFDMIVSKYDGIIEGYEHKENMIDEYIAQAEAKGHLASAEYYNALIQNKNAEKNELINKRNGMIAERNRLVSEGLLSIDSEEYRNMSNEIDGVTQEIEAAKTQTIEWQNEIRQINWDNLDLAREKMSQLNDEADFFIELMSNDKLFDGNGQMNEKGLTTMALHFANRDVYKGKAQDYADEINDIDNKISTGELDGDSQDVINRRQELVEAQRECILAAEQEEDAIKDLVREGYDKQLEALQDRIDLYEESIESAKDLYDYEKNISEQVQNIAALEKQLRAYESFNDEETRATVQKLKVELEKANSDLEETQYDKFISDQSALLDELYLEYEIALNERLDNDVALLQEKLGEVNDSLSKDGAIVSTLSGLASDVGVEMSEEFAKIWDENGKGDSIANSVGSISGVLTDIKGYVATLAGKSDKEAEENIQQPTTTTSAITDHSSDSGGSKPSSSSAGGNKSTGGDGKVKIGDRVKFLSGKYYYDSQGVNPAGSKNHGKYVYITNVNNKKWATHPIHISTGKKLGSGDLGWLKKNQISGYATGKKNFLDNEIAWTQENGKEFIVRPSDGAILTPIAKGDSVLNAQASGNIWDMANSPAEFIKDNLNLGAANVPNNANVQNNITQNLDKVVFHLPNVKNYDELVSALQKDPKFDKLIKAMTIEQIAGKSSLAKNKSIR